MQGFVYASSAVWNVWYEGGKCALKREKAAHIHSIHQAVKMYRRWPDGTKGLKW